MTATAVGHVARARVIARLAGDRTRCATIHSEPPLTFRETRERLMWVGTAAGPIGGDQLELSLRVDAGASLHVGSAAAAIVLPGPDGSASQLLIDVTVGAGATLVWRPEPTVLAHRANHRAVTTIDVGAGADLVWVDELVLGRHGEQPGTLSARLVVDRPDGPLLRTGTEIGEPGWDGPAVLDGRRALAHVLLVGTPAERWQAGAAGAVVDPSCRWAATELAPDAVLLTFAATSARPLRDAITSATPFWSPN